MFPLSHNLALSQFSNDFFRERDIIILEVWLKNLEIIRLSKLQ